MLFLEGMARLGGEAAKWAAGQKDDAAAWAACTDPRWMLWWAEYAVVDEAAIDSAVAAIVALAPQVANRDAYARKDQVAFIRPVIADQAYRAGATLKGAADAIRGVIPDAPVR